MKPVIILSSTIKTPNNTPFSKRNDSELRLLDYIESVKFYKTFNIPIVFCDNSNTNSIEINKILLENKIEFEYFSFETKVSHLGKGHGELEILDYVFSKSKIINSNTSIYKISGRYIVQNFEKILKSSKSSKVEINLSRNLFWADTKIFKLNKLFYVDHISQYKDMISDHNGVHFEHIIAKATLSYIASGYSWNQFSFYPHYKVILGTTNTSLRNNFFLKKKRDFFHYLRGYFLTKSF